MAKAIRDGVIDAVINHDDGFMQSREVTDIYSSNDPQNMLNKRFKYCMDLHNDAVKALEYPQKEDKRDFGDLDEEKSRFVKEKQINLDASHFTFAAEVIDGKGLPLATGTNIATYKLTRVDENSCTLTIEVKMRSEPAIFSTLFKGKYQEWMEKYAFGIHHFVLTQEEVTANNIKTIEEKYN